MTSYVQEAMKNGQGIQVHGWVYDLKDGLLKDLDIEIESQFKEFDLYKLD